MNAELRAVSPHEAGEVDIAQLAPIAIPIVGYRRRSFRDFEMVPT